ncbi:MAG: squalene/phytoene synthase family protein [Alphaproteobacteria bacterium]|nr:squalene/phytoene synthase family protein [Alphaproteobacteria bacterium]MBV9372075.1 squalene/phytoene synthase family protein [Alphaproteobacteria bacterium]MBV9902433.1 squalene/phytoene synthase family protein [Alphaproteobacteria bacterium]
MSAAPLDPDRVLALSYVPSRRRPAVEALWRLDAAMGAVLAGGREPMISRIKLAWWREALEKLDRAPAPAEPVLQALAEHVLARGVSGAELAEMEAGWSVLLSGEALTEADLALYAAARGATLFRCTARLLGGEGGAAGEGGEGGEAWALVDLARHSGNWPDAEAALAAARRYPLRPVPGPLRPLGMLAALARRDAEPGRPPWEPQGAPRRMLRMLRHRLTGR